MLTWQSSSPPNPLTLYSLYLFATMWTAEPRINPCFDSPTHSLILNTHALYIKNVKGMHEVIIWKKPLTWNIVSLYMAAKIPILAGPLLEANCPILRPPLLLPHPPLPSFRQHNTYLHTDDINTSDSSVGHTILLLGEFFRFTYDGLLSC